MKKSRVSYLYLKRVSAVHEVIKIVIPEGESYSEHEAMAEKKAKLLKRELAGGSFDENSKPHDFHEYIVYKIRKGTKPLVNKKDGRLAKPILSYDELEIIDDEVAFRLEEQQEEIKAGNLEDEDILSEEKIRENALSGDCLTFGYENMIENLSGLMQEKNKGNCWKVSVKNFGWRNLDGQKFFEAKTGAELLDQILPKTDCTFYIYRYRNGFKIQNYHHDSPTGNEWYYILPVADSTFEKCS